MEPFTDKEIQSINKKANEMKITKEILQDKIKQINKETRMYYDYKIIKWKRQNKERRGITARWLGDDIYYATEYRDSLIENPNKIPVKYILYNGILYKVTKILDNDTVLTECIAFKPEGYDETKYNHWFIDDEKRKELMDFLKEHDTFNLDKYAEIFGLWSD